MLTNSDFLDLLKIFKRNKVRYLVVGGYAVMRYSEPRFTKDLDLLIAIDEQNAAQVFRSLKEFGAPLQGLTARDFSQPDYFYQMGKPPVRIDILMSIPGVDFESAWQRRETIHIADAEIHFIAKQDLLASKIAAGRPQDLIDAENLKRS